MGFWSTNFSVFRVGVLFLVAIAILITGSLAYNKILPRPAYYKLDYGMSMQEAKSIMGEPRTQYSDDRTARWFYVFQYDGQRDSLQLVFWDGRLVSTGQKWRPWPHEHESRR